MRYYERVGHPLVGASFSEAWRELREDEYALSILAGTRYFAVREGNTHYWGDLKLTPEPEECLYIYPQRR